MRKMVSITMTATRTNEEEIKVSDDGQDPTPEVTTGAFVRGADVGSTSVIGAQVI